MPGASAGSATRMTVGVCRIRGAGRDGRPAAVHDREGRTAPPTASLEGQDDLGGDHVEGLAVRRRRGHELRVGSDAAGQGEEQEEAGDDRRLGRAGSAPRPRVAVVGCSVHAAQCTDSGRPYALSPAGRPAAIRRRTRRRGCAGRAAGEPASADSPAMRRPVRMSSRPTVRRRLRGVVAMRALAASRSLAASSSRSRIRARITTWEPSVQPCIGVQPSRAICCGSS